MFRSNVCTVPSDTLYSILPLLSIGEKRGLEIDYSAPFDYTMTRLETVLLKRSQSYHVLSMVSGGPRKARLTSPAYNDRDIPQSSARLMLPSWVLTWNHIEDHPLAPGRAIKKQPKLYEATATIPRFVVDGETLCVEGWLIGDIAHTTKIFDLIHNRKMVSFERETLVRIVLEDRFREFPRSAFQRINTHARDYFTELPEPSQLQSELKSRGSRACRYIAKTNSKLSANVPWNTRLGDVVAIFHRGEVPYVLRPEAGGYHILIGEW
jgi:hypothetical protein